MEQVFKSLTATVYRNAFLFWNCRDLVYSDSRMFLAPVPVRNNLAYIGENGFRHPTLGVYLEWWERCGQSHVLTEKDVSHKTKEERLIWFISGSPLSGCNVCASADKSGETKTTPVYAFSTAWRSFAEINNRYNAIKHLYAAYSLEQVVGMLNNKEQPEPLSGGYHHRLSEAESEPQ